MSFIDLTRTLRAVVICLVARMSSKRAGVALVYHRVGGTTSGDPKREILPTVASGLFARQMRHLRRHYSVVPAGELLDAVRNRRRWERFPVAVTFDDDLSGHLHEAAPILRSSGAMATFFLGGVSLGGVHPFWWEDLQRAVDGRLVGAGDLPHIAEIDLRDALDRRPRAIFRVAGTIEQLEAPRRRETAAALRDAVGSTPADPGLRRKDVAALVEAGFEVGFHTVEHPSLPALADDELETALRLGREALAAVVGKPLDLLSYPYGRADARVAKAARVAGFRFAFTTSRDAVTPDTDPSLIPRIPPALGAGKMALRVARAISSRS